MRARDDGAYGSGTRDGVLATNQEDLKSCLSRAFIGHTIEDGCNKDGSWVAYGGGDFNAECVFVVADSHWEVEFAIPFVGNDGGMDDFSDLVCTTADTIGIKFQYFTQPGANNHFYPEGTQYQIKTYNTLTFLPCPGVIPEVPLGTIVASAAMIIALAAYVAVPRWRRKQK